MAAQYPTAAGTDANLFVAANNKSTTLSDNPLTSGATTVNVASTTGFPTAGYITIDAEAIKYTGVTGTSFTSCTRGADGTTAAAHTLNSQVLHTVVADHHNVLKDEIKAVEGDLVAINSALTPTSATSTSTSLLNRINMIVNQIKALSGQTNWYDSIAKNITQYLALSGGTMSGAIAMGTSKITGLGNGTAAQDAAAFGQIKMLQLVSASTVTSTSTSSTSYVDANNMSVTITPSSASNRVRVMVSGLCSVSGTEILQGTVLRGGTDVFSSGSPGIQWGGFAGRGTVTVHVIDSPATTSSTVYKLQIKSVSGGTVVFGNGQTATITVEEIV